MNDTAAYAGNFLRKLTFFGDSYSLVESSHDDLAATVIASLFPEELEISPPAGTPKAVDLELFQRIAVAKACRAMDQWGGVLLCDSVGLGKTYVAIEIARLAFERGEDVLVLIPAALRTQWTPLLQRHLAPDIASRKLATVRTITHTQLSRGSFAEAIVDRKGVIIVDEAHAFRTPGTRRHRALKSLCTSRRVCLITATPVNNSLRDLYHLIRLFATDTTFAKDGIPHLHALFDEMSQAASSPPAFARLLRAVMIRRTRAEVRNMPAASRKLRFPYLTPPISVDYDPDAGVEGSHAAILESIDRLDLGAVGQSSSALLRFLLLKRLASSPAAFQATTRRLLLFHREFILACDQGLFLSPRDCVFDGAGREQLSIRGITLRPVRPGENMSVLREAATHDAELLAFMLHATPLHPLRDDKLERLKTLALQTLRDRRILVFTEFRETAIYLWRRLAGHGGVGLVHGDGAFLGVHRAGRNTVIERFSRSHHSRRAFHLREQVRILIATDVLSEGVNLQECAHVVSYDLPWNPVRIMQRIGRIDRLGSPHERVYAYNFLPDMYLERYLHLLARLRIKLHAIGLSLGLEQPVLANPGDKDFEYYGWSHLRDGHLPDGSEWLNKTATLRTWLRSSCHAGMPLPTKAASTDGTAIPLVLLDERTLSLPREMHEGHHQKWTLCLILKSDTGFISAYVCGSTSVREIDAEVVAASFVAGGTQAREDSGAVWTGNAIARQLRLVERYLQSSVTAYRPVRPVENRDPTLRKLAHRLISALSAVSGGPSPAEVARAERLLEQLDRNDLASTGDPAALAGAFAPSADFSSVADAVECITDSTASLNRDPISQRNAARPTWKIIAAIGLRTRQVTSLTQLTSVDHTPSNR